MKSSFPSDSRVWLTLGLLFLFLLAITPRTGKFAYDYRKGSPWAYDNLTAQFDFPILKTSEQLQAETQAAGSSVIPYYRYSENATLSIVRAAEGADLKESSYLRPLIVKSLSEIFERGVISDAGEEQGERNGRVIFVQKGKHASRRPASDVYTLESAKAKLLSDALKAYPDAAVDSVYTSCGVYDIIRPNLEFDKETTELVHAENGDYISPTSGYVNSGELIVSKGEMVTSDIQQLLDSYKAEYENSLGYKGLRIWLWAGDIIIALALTLLFFLIVFYGEPSVFEKPNKLLFLVIIFAITSFAALTGDKLDPSSLYLIPFVVSALYLRTFFEKRLALPLYLASLLPLLIFAHGGTELYVMYAVAGSLSLIVFEHFNKGWRQFVSALVVFLTLSVVYLAFLMLNDRFTTEGLSRLILLFLGSLLTVATYPLVFLFEKFLSLVSVSRLLELCDTNNNKLIIELANKAPGTFQHSLQVMNLCDAAARSIDANVLLIKAGALYHDIGKIANPQCFIENENLGAQYHEGLSPKESAKDIIRHVADGLEMADRYGLPDVVKDFILTHHGTSCTGFFYNKFINDGGDPADTAEFFYPGRKPVTKEQTIMMLCDSLEAASRTLKDNSQETFDSFVENMTASKIASGQFSDSQLSISELNTIKTVLKSYLAQIYHQRVAYPKRNNE